MIEVERNNGGVHNVERILVQDSVNVTYSTLLRRGSRERLGSDPAYFCLLFSHKTHDQG